MPLRMIVVLIPVGLITTIVSWFHPRPWSIKGTLACPLRYHLVRTLFPENCPGCIVLDKFGNPHAVILPGQFSPCRNRTRQPWRSYTRRRHCPMLLHGDRGVEDHGQVPVLFCHQARCVQAAVGLGGPTRRDPVSLGEKLFIVPSHTVRKLRRGIKMPTEKENSLFTRSSDEASVESRDGITGRRKDGFRENVADKQQTKGFNVVQLNRGKRQIRIRSMKSGFWGLVGRFFWFCAYASG